MTEAVVDFTSPDPHPSTIEFAKKLIDELQTKNMYASVPRVPAFSESRKKLSVNDMFGSSDSEAVSDADFSKMNAASSGSEESMQERWQTQYFYEMGLCWLFLPPIVQPEMEKKGQSKLF